jgi:pSer/pThr/pTyr-binding forkhead associated (FHA) protein
MVKNTNDSDNFNLMDTERIANLPRHISIIVGETDEYVEVLLNHPIIIGRDDDTTSVDLDLTHKGGYRLGLSRQHLRLAPAGVCVVAADLNSRNGSKLNGEIMQPMQDYPIHTGDTLQLSGLNLHVYSIN